MNNNEKDKDNEILNNQLNQILILLQTIQCQVKRISTFQDSTYQWNNKHHQYLQNVLKSFNKINTIFNNNNNNNGNINIEINNENQNQNSNSISFHEKILSIYDPLNPFSKELESLIMQIDKNLFDELQEESIQIIYPFLLKWLKDEQQQKTIEDSSSLGSSQIIIALVLLWEISIKFNSLNKKFKDINKKLLVCLNLIESKGTILKLYNQGVFPFNEYEYLKLKKYLE